MTPPVNRPVLMSGAMVRATLSGAKTVTRRILKPQPRIHPEIEDRELVVYNGDTPVERRPLPYVPGQLLWVRETWAHYHTINHIRRSHGGAFSEVSDGLAGYRADGHETIDDFKRHVRLMSGANFEGIEVRGDCWHPSIHMPRWASRLTLEVTGVKVERLQDISEEDCIAEGCQVTRASSGDPRMGTHRWFYYDCTVAGDYIGAGLSPRAAFEMLWDYINGPTAWSDNPWIVAITFKSHKRNIDQVIAEQQGDTHGQEN